MLRDAVLHLTYLSKELLQPCHRNFDYRKYHNLVRAQLEMIYRALSLKDNFQGTLEFTFLVSQKCIACSMLR